MSGSEKVIISLAFCLTPTAPTAPIPKCKCGGYVLGLLYPWDIVLWSNVLHIIDLLFGCLS